LLSVVAQALLCNFLCLGSASLLSDDANGGLSVGGLDFCVLDYMLEPVTGVELPKEVFTSKTR
jgi:hypothetical protein